MRIAATAATLFALASCSTTPAEPISPYQQPNSLMKGEISRRVEQIPYQHREELLQNLLWLAQTGEQTIPTLISGLDHDSPKVRSSCAWVLGRIRDRRTIPNLQSAMHDSEPSVRMEAARTLVMMGDLQQSPTLIEGLDSERKEVRYLCHEALKTATGHDFGYDHLNKNTQELQVATLRWRQWWGEYSGDQFFATNYAEQHNIGGDLAAPGGETKMMDEQPGKQEEPAPVQNEMPDESTTVESVEMPPTEVPAEVPSEPVVETPVESGEELVEVPSSNEVSGESSESETPVIEVPAVEVPSPQGSTETPVVEVPADPNGGN